MQEENAASRSASISANYKQRLRANLEEITLLWATLMVDGWAAPGAQRISEICHALAGSAETFGYPHVSRVARLAETRIAEVLAEGSARPAQLNSLREAIEALTSATPPIGASTATSTDEESRTPPANADPSRNVADDVWKAGGDVAKVTPLSMLPIYIVEDDRELADHIVMQLALRGYDGRAVYDLADLERMISEGGGTPGALVMDVIFPEAASGGIDIINKFRSDQILQAPVLFMSASDSFDTRLEIIRAGADAFFVKPLDTELLIEKLEALLGDTDPDPLRVLVVDDDDIFAELACGLLERAGILARPLTRPRDTINAILEYQPDLVLLDMYMPEVNGMEVAQVLRQHESCSDLPILFLSGESDPAKRAAALNVGVDDFLVKPVDHRYLVSSVANRAQRARALRGKAVRDSLTQLLVHDEIRVQLVNNLSTARRYSRPLSYAMIDIDRFKLINDSHGHMTGDHVLKGMASLLRRSFRRGDVLGRYGGEEFVVIMQDTPVEQAVKVINRLREEFARTSHRSTVTGEDLLATFSAGISSYPTFDVAADMQNQADRALYLAKDRGRNQVVVAERDHPDGPA